MIRTIGLLGVTCVMGLLACNGDVSDDGDELGAESDVTGVQDLTAMEKALDFVKDVKGPTGYKRNAATVRAGPCYKKTILGADGANYQFRRYTQGAAFFHKLGTAPATGDDRPVVCVDVDTKDEQGKAYTAAFGRYELDLSMRYKFGREDGGYSDAKSSSTYFENGTLDATTKVPAGTADSLDTPVFHGRAFDTVTIYGKGTFSAVLARLVWQYAWKSATAADVFTLGTDPVGNFQGIDIGPTIDLPPGYGDGEGDGGEGDGGEGDGEGGGTTLGNYARVQHLRFTRLDAHLVRTPPVGTTPGSEKLYLTPKLSDDKLAARATASCTRPLDKKLKPTGKFVCTGM